MTQHTVATAAEPTGGFKFRNAKKGWLPPLDKLVKAGSHSHLPSQVTCPMLATGQGGKRLRKGHERQLPKRPHREQRNAPGTGRDPEAHT